MGLTSVTLVPHMLGQESGLKNLDMLRVVHPLSTYN